MDDHLPKIKGSSFSRNLQSSLAYGEGALTAVQPSKPLIEPQIHTLKRPKLKALEMLSFANVFQRPSPIKVRVDPSPEDLKNKKSVLRSVLNAHLQLMKNGEV